MPPPLTRNLNDDFKAQIVQQILAGQPEDALTTLAKHLRIDPPQIRVGVLKRRTKGILAVYSPQTKTIYAARREYMYDPLTILHEFYHHLRTIAGEHRGTEKYADRFAREFMESYMASQHHPP